MVWPPETIRAMLGCGPRWSSRNGERRWPSMWLTAMKGLPVVVGEGFGEGVADEEGGGEAGAGGGGEGVDVGEGDLCVC